MREVRPLSEKYKISKHRFFELYHFCLQYNEWKDILKSNTDGVGAIVNDGLPHGNNTSDSTGNIGTLRAEISQKCEIVEQTAIEAAPEIYKYILKAVTNENVTYHYLSNFMKMPCGKKMYYENRRKFYWLLSKKVKKI